MSAAALPASRRSELLASFARNRLALAALIVLGVIVLAASLLARRFAQHP